MPYSPRTRTPEEAAEIRRQNRQRRYAADPSARQKDLDKVIAWGQANRERKLQAQRVWQAAHRAERSKRERPKQIARRWAQRLEMIAAYGGECACCGETEPVFLTLDHVNGDGAAHRRSMNSPSIGGARTRMV